MPLVVTMCLVVALRYLFNYSSIPLQELVIYLHATIFLAGSAYTLKHNEHVRVDILYQRFSPRVKAWVDLLGTLLLLLPMLVFIAIYSWPYVSRSWSILEKSQETAGLPAVFLLKSLILVMVALLLVQVLADVLRHGQRALSRSAGDA